MTQVWDEEERMATFYKLLEPPAWHADAKCKGKTEMFYPSRAEVGAAENQRPGRQETYAARQICATCPVAEPCRQAGEKEYHGIWGGLSARQRQTVRRKRRATEQQLADLAEARRRGDRERYARHKAEAEAAGRSWP